MAKITDPDSLVVDTEITIDTSAKTFILNVAGNLIAKDGASAQAIYSKFIDLWTTASYNKFSFPAYVIGDPRAGMFVWGFDGAAYNGWKPGNDATRTYIRDAGWSEYSSGGVLNRQYVGAVSLGDVNTGAQLYYQRASADAPSNYTFTDEVNEAIQVYGDASNGDFDKRTFFKTYCREYQYSYASANLALIGETATGAYKIGLPIANALDLNITAVDAAVDSSSPYTVIKVRYFAQAYSKDIDTVGSPRDFGIVCDVGTHSGIDGAMSSAGSTLTSSAGTIPTDGTYDGGVLTVHDSSSKGTYTIGSIVSATAVPITTTFPATDTSASFTLQRVTPVTASKQQIYTKIQRLLRLNSDIDETAGTVTGKTADALLSMAGATLEAGKATPTNPNGGGSGVCIEGFLADDATTIDFYDNGGVKRNFPFNSTGTLNFNSFLVSAPGYYRMYFTDLPGDADYGFTNAITVNNAAGSPIAGTITSASINWDFAYDTNTQGGRSAGTNAAVTVVAGKPGYAKPVVATYTITRAVGQGITLTAEQDRAYLT